jgi:geranylgeranyl diphosphate synthase type I
MKKTKSTDPEIVFVAKKRAEKALERFRTEAVFGVSDPELLAILREVLSYWKDSSRPAIASYSCEAVGGKPEIADDAGLIFVFAAAGTGIHDDIIDKSLKNHFRWTVLGLYGLEKALLVGDLLLVKAWSMLQECVRNCDEPLRVIEIIDAYGLISVQICEAEFLEMSCRKRLDIDLSFRERILWNINADIEACAKTGAIIGGGSDEEVLALSGVGRRLGFLLGLKDEVEDCLNIQGNLSHRLLFESVPLPLVYAARSSGYVQTKLQSIIQKDSIDPAEIADIVRLCIDTGAFSYVYELAKRNANDAIKMLKEVPRNSATINLELIVKNAVGVMEKLCLEYSS